MPPARPRRHKPPGTAAAAGRQGPTGCRPTNSGGSFPHAGSLRWTRPAHQRVSRGRQTALAALARRRRLAHGWPTPDANATEASPLPGHCANNRGASLNRVCWTVTSRQDDRSTALTDTDERASAHVGEGGRRRTPDLGPEGLFVATTRRGRRLQAHSAARLPAAAGPSRCGEWPECSGAANRVEIRPTHWRGLMQMGGKKRRGRPPRRDG